MISIFTITSIQEVAFNLEDTLVIPQDILEVASSQVDNLAFNLVDNLAFNLVDNLVDNQVAFALEDTS